LWGIERLRDVGNGRLEAAVATFHFAGLEALGYLLDKRHFVGFIKERCNNQQGFELALWECAGSLLDVVRNQQSAEGGRQTMDAF
jgi:hypothetical protein